MKFKKILKESQFKPQLGKVYCDPFVKSFMKENDEAGEDERESQIQLNPEEKKSFLEAVAKFNEYKNAIYRTEGLVESFKSIKNLVEIANKITIDETQDWFDNVTVSRHMKRMNESFKVFEKSITEINTLQQRLESSYEEIGEVLNKYYKINDDSMKLSEMVKSKRNKVIIKK
jgi:hypothetical protein